ncbi:hypothetical protein K432DRAFT_396784 [Lepidopterella palustris CBS 459.81]|uniref:Uncharacterized protein n=1 Tax=Lepidopterella palustris CBS 459.81 TaxID=1314670 RepID=A0A8E2E2F0_9PEZI|nr:hypothetical protein K432DRAFT_396784 [Lepidopterella palustris CBS 459.81]
MSNKDRVFVALYVRDGITGTESIRSKPNHSIYVWGIWIEPKGSSGEGTSFSVEESSGFADAENPAGWNLVIKGYSQWPHAQLGRIMIGKLPEGFAGADVAALLRDIPLPDAHASPVENGVTWMKMAIGELQRNGCAERFSVDQFVDDALGYADAWYAKDKRGERNEKINYTWSRTFP